MIPSRGRSLILSIDQQLQTEPWIDISDLVNNAGDRGLLGITIHPQYAQGKPYVYLLFAQVRHSNSTNYWNNLF